MNTPEETRLRDRLLASECGALIDRLNELYPATAVPDLNATDREIGAWLGVRKLLAGLNRLREERHAEGKVLGGS